MMHFKIIKLLFSTFLLFATVQSIKAQQSKKKLQLLPSIGMPIQFLPKDIYSGKPLNFSQQFGLEIKKKISSKFSISLEGQYGIFNLKQNIKKTYGPYIQNDSFGNYHQSTLLNGIVNFSYTKYSKNAKNMFELGIGAGIQQLKQGANTLSMRNPYQANTLTNVYRNVEGKYTTPLVQLTLQNTFYIKPCLGITVGVKAQYAKAEQVTTYKKIPPNTDGQLAYEQFINSKEIETKQQSTFTLIPTIGIRFVFGGCKGKNTKTKPTDSCFGLEWQNKVPKDSCFRGDKLKFLITQKNINPNATVYDILIAPINNLNDQTLLFTLPYPSGSFFINTVLLDADKEYAVIIKLKSRKKEEECLQYIQPVKRCADCCKDVNLQK